MSFTDLQSLNLKIEDSNPIVSILSEILQPNKVCKIQSTGYISIYRKNMIRI